jgi:hypothetical protein
MFCACIYPDLNVAMAILPMFLMPLMIFCGYFVNADSIPPYFIWIEYMSPMKYGFGAVVINEFSGLEINCGPGDGCAPGYNGDTVIRNMGIDGDIPWNCGILIALTGFFMLLAYIMLAIGVRKTL